ncbi:RICIN domain-containing protein [Poriferisphaera sp. WC338]|uniref:RICIN domain-containing protein n=1 Tax=Poriferisphaera sp. WC338 TaxID=3425129 RepID=UPI003D813F2F
MLKNNYYFDVQAISNKKAKWMFVCFYYALVAMVVAVCMLSFMLPSTVDADGLEANLIYKISSKANGNVLEVQSHSQNDGASVIEYVNFDNPNQQWRLKYLGDGYYSLVNINSSKYMDIAGQSLISGAQIVQNTLDHNSDSQKWMIEYVYHGYCRIKSKHSGKYITTSSGITVEDWDVGEIDKQVFRFDQVRGENLIGEHIYAILRKGSQKALSVDVDMTDFERRIDQRDYVGLASQQWRLHSNGDGSFAIINIDSDKCLDVLAYTHNDGGEIVQIPHNGVTFNNNQLWEIKHVADGYYRIKSKHSGKYLTIASSASGKPFYDIPYKDYNGETLPFVDPSIANPSQGQKERLVQYPWRMHDRQLFKFEQTTGQQQQLAMSNHTTWGDSTIIWSEGHYYAYFNDGIVKRSNDLSDWASIAPNDLNSYNVTYPHIRKIVGSYYLYYNEDSTNGDSEIHFTKSEKLNPNDNDYGWASEQAVALPSGSSLLDANNPHMLNDAVDDLWMVYTNSSNTIFKIARMDQGTGNLKDSPIQIGSYSDLGSSFNDPVIVYCDGWYYLFLNYFKLGSHSEIVVGRSRNIVGPYKDRDGDGLFAVHGGTTVAGTDDDVKSIESFSIAHGLNGRDYLSVQSWYKSGSAPDYFSTAMWGMTYPLQWVGGWPHVEAEILTEGDPADGVVADGEYKLELVGGNTGRVLQADSGDGKPIIWDSVAQENQEFTLTYLDNGFYSIKVTRGGVTTVVAVADSQKGYANVPDTDPTVRIVTDTWDESHEQQWRIEEVEAGVYKIVNLFSGRVLSVQHWASHNGAYVIQTEWIDHPNQKWQLISTGN